MSAEAVPSTTGDAGTTGVPSRENVTLPPVTGMLSLKTTAWASIFSPGSTTFENTLRPVVVPRSSGTSETTATC